MNGGQEDKEFEKRLASAIDAADLKKSKKPGESSAAAAQSAISMAMRLGVELVAAMLIAVLIGYGLDQLFKTSPWLMILMVPVGMFAGLRNLVRASGTKPRV